MIQRNKPQSLSHQPSSKSDERKMRKKGMSGEKESAKKRAKPGNAKDKQLQKAAQNCTVYNTSRNPTKPAKTTSVSANRPYVKKSNIMHTSKGSHS